MVKEGLRIVAVLSIRCSYLILLALNIADVNDNVLNDGHLRVHVMLKLYNWESILIGVDGSRLLRCHDVFSIYIPLGISNLDVGTTLFPSMILPLVKHGIKELRLKNS